MSHKQSLTITSLQHNRTSLVSFLAYMGECTDLFSDENMKSCQKSRDSLFLDFTPFLLSPS